MEKPPLDNSEERSPLPKDFAIAMLASLKRQLRIYQEILDNENITPLEKTITDLHQYQKTLINAITDLDEQVFADNKQLLLGLNNEVTTIIKNLDQEYNDRKAASSSFSEMVTDYYQDLMQRMQKLIDRIEPYA